MAYNLRFFFLSFFDNFEYSDIVCHFSVLITDAQNKNIDKGDVNKVQHYLALPTQIYKHTITNIMPVAMTQCVILCMLH